MCSPLRCRRACPRPLPRSIACRSDASACPHTHTERARFALGQGQPSIPRGTLTCSFPAPRADEHMFPLPAPRGLKPAGDAARSARASCLPRGLLSDRTWQTSHRHRRASGSIPGLHPPCSSGRPIHPVKQRPSWSRALPISRSHCGTTRVPYNEEDSVCPPPPPRRLACQRHGHHTSDWKLCPWGFLDTYGCFQGILGLLSPTLAPLRCMVGSMTQLTPPNFRRTAVWPTVNSLASSIMGRFLASWCFSLVSSGLHLGRHRGCSCADKEA